MSKMKTAGLMAAAMIAAMTAPQASDAAYVFRSKMTTSAPLAVVSDAGTRIFLTAGSWSGALGGLAGADAKCMGDANKPSDGRTYVAVLSTSTTAANTRVSVTYPVRRAGDASITVATANVWNSLTAPVSAGGGTADVWTGSSTGGTYSYAACNDWQSGSGSGNGTLGSSSATSGSWIGAAMGGCDYPRRIYCMSTS